MIDGVFEDVMNASKISIQFDRAMYTTVVRPSQYRLLARHFVPNVLGLDSSSRKLR